MTVRNEFKPVAELIATVDSNIERACKRDGEMSGVATGFVDLDNLLGGLQPSDLIVLAARPSMGKTALATAIALHAAKNYRTDPVDDDRSRRVEGAAVVGYFSHQVSAEQLVYRLISMESGIDSEKMRRGLLLQDDFEKIVLASQRLSRIPLFIDDTPGLSVHALHTRTRRLARTCDLSIVIVDYLQLMQPVRGVSYESPAYEIAQITEGLKRLARELDVPILALLQLSPFADQRVEKRPQLSDLHEWGAIEKDVDVVIFLHREEYYLVRAEPMRRAIETDDEFETRLRLWQSRLETVAGTAEVIVAKHRHGPTGNLRLKFLGETTMFADLDSGLEFDEVPF